MHGNNHTDMAKPPKVYGALSMIALAVSLMATWEALCSTMGAGLVSGGPVSLVWGFLGEHILSVPSM